MSPSRARPRRRRCSPAPPGTGSSRRLPSPAPIDSVVTTERLPYGVWDRITGKRPGALVAARERRPVHVDRELDAVGHRDHVLHGLWRRRSRRARRATGRRRPRSRASRSRARTGRSRRTAPPVQLSWIEPPSPHHVKYPHLAIRAPLLSHRAHRFGARAPGRGPRFLAAELPRGEFTPGSGWAPRATRSSRASSRRRDGSGWRSLRSTAVATGPPSSGSLSSRSCCAGARRSAFTGSPTARPVR